MERKVVVLRSKRHQKRMSLRASPQTGVAIPHGDATKYPNRVIARSEATWQSPGTILYEKSAQTDAEILV